MSKSSRKSKSPRARVTSSKEVYRGPAFWVTTDHVVEPNGIRARRDVVRHTGSVVILAVRTGSKKTEILLEHQYRHAAQSYMWELPAGRIDKEEKELPAAKRELLEETGFTARRWKRVLRFYASPGFVAETMSIYLALDLKAGIAQPEADESIETRFVTVNKALEMIKKGTIQDAKTLSGVLWLSHRLHQNSHL